MFISFYDKDFNTVDNNSSLSVESYDLSRRSYDLNTFSCTCEPIDLTVEPMFAVMRDNKGKKYYDCLQPIYTRDKSGKGTVEARDLKAVFNTEAIIDFSATQVTVKTLLDYIFTAWKNSANSGFANVQFVTDSISDVGGEVYQPTEKKAYNVLDLFGQLMAYYELYFEGEIDIKTKTLKFTVRKSKETTVKIKLEEYGITDFAKAYPETNMVTAATSDFSTTKKWFLLQSGQITDKENLQDIFPTSGKVITAETIAEANTEAILELAENRNQESIEITVTPNDRNYNIDFNTSVVVYYAGKEYKTLPIGEISEDEGTEKKITLGYKPVELIQLI